MRYVVPSRLAYVVADDASDDPVVFLMPLPDGPPVVISGSAALIWIIAARGEADVAEEVARRAGWPAEEIVDQVRSYLERLVTTGLLEGRHQGTTNPVDSVGWGISGSSPGTVSFATNPPTQAAQMYGMDEAGEQGSLPEQGES